MIELEMKEKAIENYEGEKSVMVIAVSQACPFPP
jgi:hypothetical protein